MKNEMDTGSPRLFVENDLAENTTLPLDDKQAHYLKNVLRRPEGSSLRVFNGRDGEYLAQYSARDRKNFILNIGQLLKSQTVSNTELHLVFTPIRKDRQDFMIEKAVELGVTHLHPVLTQHTTVRDLNEIRVQKQIQEAAEQCERLDLPQLIPLQKLEESLKFWPEIIPLYAAIEREDAPFIGKMKPESKVGLLIGPEGGFSDDEKKLLLAYKKITPVNLGKNILRAETAAVFGLSIILVNYIPS